MPTAAAKKKPFKALTQKLNGLLDTHPVIFTAILAFLLTLLIEMISRHSPWKGLVFVFVHPINFLANYFIVLSTVSLGHFFKKRNFFITFLSLLWLIAGTVNGVMLFFRVTPFGTIDFALISTAMGIFSVYLEIWQMVLAGVLILLFIAGMVVLYIRSRKQPVKIRMAAVLSAASILLAVGAYSVTVVGHEDKRA